MSYRVNHFSIILFAGSGVDVPTISIQSPHEAVEAFNTALPILELPEIVAYNPGNPDPTSGAMTIHSISTGVEFVRTGRASNIVTNPINKHVLYSAGFKFPGHTEYLAKLAEQWGGPSIKPVMMLASEQLRTVPLTIHIALADVAKHITSELIIETASIISNDLTKYFGIKSPRIAVAGLNPHAGENGSMGRAEIEVIEPALGILKGRGINVSGPYPADTLFHAKARKNYDVVLGMYHDQALIPIKTLGFDEGVNTTLGLPFVRTSPDHGTAYDIAGKNIANPTSLIEALKNGAKNVLPCAGVHGTMIDDLPPLRDVIKTHDLAARKSLGQNFLLDLNLTSRIARLSGVLEDTTVLEIGPGPGGLTRALLSEGAAKLIAIERDARCLPALDQISAYYPGKMEIVNADALDYVYSPKSAHEKIKIVANLPYNIATKLLIDWLRAPSWPPFYQSMTLMFQKEVAQRIVARLGGKAYGRLAVISQWRTHPEIVLKLPARAFTPAPKVDSAVVHFTPIEPVGEPCRLEDLEKITAAAFGQRRKMLRSSLKQISKQPLELLSKADIKPQKRAEELSIEEFTRLANVFADSVGD